ncbi:MAG: LysR substrate-binding domain-containing protein [Planctomycetota bacterium]|nr:LysR substrate-binding domain-containing protein [Planctomycetota bacterium]
MELHQLRYVLAVAETGGFIRAAEACGIAQPSLSQQIIKLERELGTPLFDRLGRSVALTDAGRALLPHARNALQAVREAERAVREDPAGGKGPLAVGAIPTIAPYLLPPVVKSFTRAFPHAELTIREDLTERMIDALKRAEIDLAILSPPIDDDAIETEDLFHEPFLVAVPKQHALSKAKNIPLRGLEEENVVVLHEMHCLGQQMESFCRASGIHRRIVCRTTQLGTVQEMVSLGLGVSLTPKMCADADKTSKRAYLPLQDAHPGRTIAIAWRKGRTRSRLAEGFAQILRGNSAI